MLRHFALERSSCETSSTCGDNLNKKSSNVNNVPFEATLNPVVMDAPDRLMERRVCSVISPFL